MGLTKVRGRKLGHVLDVLLNSIESLPSNISGLSSNISETSPFVEAAARSELCLLNQSHSAFRE